MSNKIKNNNSGISNDIVNCERYLTKMRQANSKLNEYPKRNKPEKKIVCPFMTVPIPKKLTPRVAVTKHEATPKLHTSPTSLQSKSRDILHPSPQRTRPRSAKSCYTNQSLKSEKNTWSSTLEQRPRTAQEYKGSFDQFDPLRTLHFLTKELHSKVSKAKNTTRDETDIHKVVSDMQVVLQRLPSEMSCTQEQTSPSNEKKYYNKENFPFPVAREKPSTIPVEHKASQTNLCFKKSLTESQAEILQNKMEKGITKLADTCQSLEQSCTNLRKERDELRRQLHIEQKNSNLLQQQLQQQEQNFINIRKTLEDKVEALQSEIMHIKNEVKGKLEIRNELLEGEMKEAKRVATIAQMDYEKLYVLISARDKQLEKLHAEFAAMQTLVTEQLTDFKNEKRQPICSSPSSHSELVTPSWPILSNIHSELTLTNDPEEYCSFGKQVLHIKDNSRGDNSELFIESEISFMELPSVYSVTNIEADSRLQKDSFVSHVSLSKPYSTYPQEQGDGSSPTFTKTQLSRRKHRSPNNTLKCEPLVASAKKTVRELIQEVRHSMLKPNNKN